MTVETITDNISTIERNIGANPSADRCELSLAILQYLNYIGLPHSQLHAAIRVHAAWCELTEKGTLTDCLDGMRGLVYSNFLDVTRAKRVQQNPDRSLLLDVFNWDRSLFMVTAMQDKAQDGSSGDKRNMTMSIPCEPFGLKIGFAIRAGEPVFKGVTFPTQFSFNI